MPLTNPWLAGPAPDRDLPRHELEERILYTEHWLRRQGYRPRQTWRPTERAIGPTIHP